MFFQRKIFVGGILATTAKAKLFNYFSAFGQIEDCVIMVDRDHSKWSKRVSDGNFDYVKNPEASVL